MATAQELVDGSLRLIGVVGQGEPTSAADGAVGLTALQDMLADWSSQNLTLPSVTVENFSLVIGQTSYTYGTGGNFNASRPEAILSAYIRIGSGAQAVDYPLVSMTEGEYAGIAVKALQARPQRYWYNPTVTTGTVYFECAPDVAYSIYFDALKPLSQPANLAATASFPDQYRSAIKYNLAVRLAPEYQRPVSPEVALTAGQTLLWLKVRNYKPQVLGVDSALLVDGYRFDINTGVIR